MSKPFPNRPIGRKSVLLALAVSVIRGGNQVALKFALVAFAPFWTALGRMAIGAVAVGCWSRLRGIPLLPRPDERNALVSLGVLFTLQIGLMHYGADFTSPAYATVLMNSNPIFTSFFAHFAVPGDRLSQRRLLGLVIAFAGVCVVFLGRPEARLASAPLFGNLLLLISSILVAMRTIYTQRVVQRIKPEKTALWQMIFSLPLFLAAALWDVSGPREAVDWRALSAVFYQGVIVGGLGFTVWAHLLRHHAPGPLTFFNFTVPLFGVALSAVMMGEAVTSRLIFGAAAVFIGIWLATATTRKRGALKQQEGPREDKAPVLDAPLGE